MVLREEDRLVLPVRTIHRILERQGLVADDVHAPALRRFERAAPNGLWQMDTKGSIPCRKGSVIRCRCWMIAAAMRWACTRCRF